MAESIAPICSRMRICARADARTMAAGTPGYTLMTRAGAAVAEAAVAMAGGPGLGGILVLCGPGHNGGDGFVAARLLAEHGHEVAVALLGPAERMRGDAARAASEWRGPLVAADAITPARAGLVVDALFGSGLDRDLDGAAPRRRRAPQRGGRPILAVDMPVRHRRRHRRRARGCRAGGAHRHLRGEASPGTSSIRDGPIAARSRSPTSASPDETVAEARQPHLRQRAGAVAEAFPRPDARAATNTAAATRSCCRARAPTPARRGSPRAARSASAPVSSTLASPTDALAVNAAQLTAVMLRRCDGPEELAALLADARFNAVALGPALGIGAATRALVGAALAADRAVVLDADALTSFEGDAAALAGLAERRARRRVLTPHEGEFARLFTAKPVRSTARRSSSGRAGRRR